MKTRLLALGLLLFASAPVASAHRSLVSSPVTGQDFSTSKTLNLTLQQGFLVNGTFTAGTGETLASVSAVSTTTQAAFAGTVNQTANAYSVLVPPDTYNLVLTFTVAGASTSTTIQMTDTSGGATPFAVSADLKRNITLPAVTTTAVAGTVTGLNVSAVSATLAFTSTTISPYSLVTTTAFAAGGFYNANLPTGTYDVKTTQVFTSSGAFTSVVQDLGSSAVSNPHNVTVPTFTTATVSGNLTFTGSASDPTSSFVILTQNASSMTVSAESALPSNGAYSSTAVTGTTVSENVFAQFQILSSGTAPLAIYTPPAVGPGGSITGNTSFSNTFPAIPGIISSSTITGQVTIFGTITPVANATVVVTSSTLTGDSNSSFSTSATTDAHGNYSLTVPIGTNYSVLVSGGFNTSGDYDGDGKADMTVFRPSMGTFYSILSDPTASQQQWGTNGDIPVRGDFDGDGITDIGVFRPSTGQWFVIPSATPGSPIIQNWGTSGDIPVPGDYDGDGKTDFAVFRPTTGQWFVIPSATPGSPIIQSWGTGGDIPVPGDYDGDGKVDYAVYRPSNGFWYIIPSSNPGTPIIKSWGTSGDIPVPGDYDGDGISDFAVWRPSNGFWYIIPSSNPATPILTSWGTSGDIPVPVDYDGDRKTDVAVWRAGTWYVLPSGSPGTSTQTSWGASGDLPLQAPIGAALGAPAKLVFTTQPGGATGGTALGPQPAVAVEDAYGNKVTSSNALITLGIKSGTGAAGAQLTCSSDALAASAGVATFSSCSLNLASGNSYKLTATSSGLASAVSAAFLITVGPPAQLAFTTQPGGGTGGVALSTQPAVAVEDAGGNIQTAFAGSVTVAIWPGSGAGPLACTATTVAMVSGVASFANCRLNTEGNGYALMATSTGLPGVVGVSNPFDVTIGPAARLIFSGPPVGAVAGAAFAAQPFVVVKDAGNDTVFNSSASITLSITAGTGTAGAALACTNATVVASSGSAPFANCSINTAGSAYTLTATSAGLTNVISPAFNVEASMGMAAKLVFTTQPASGETGLTLNTVQVTVEDSNGVPIPSATNTISLILDLNGSPVAFLGGTTQVTASGGVAAFSNLTVSTAGSAYTLVASASGLTSVTSAGFVIYNSLAPTCTGAPSGNEYLMTGHWAALVQGWTGGGAGWPMHSLFAISTDGAGGLMNLDGMGMGGQFDGQRGQSGAGSYSNLTILQAGSSYVIGPDPAGAGYVGCMTLALSNGGTQHYRFALGGITGSSTSARASKGTIVRWDDMTGTGARGSGVMLPQDSTKFLLSAQSANYAYGLSGVDPTGLPFSEAGGETLNTSTGAVTFEFDYDDSGSGGLVTGGTGTLSGISSLTGRGTSAATVTINGVPQNNNSIVYIVNSNEYLILLSDPYSTNPIASGRAIVTTHGSFSAVSGNLMVHLTGTSTVAGGGGCPQNGLLQDCADVNLVALTATITGAQTSSLGGYSWEYKMGNSVTPDAIIGITGTVDATWGRLVLSGANAQQAPVFYLATPQANTEPFLAFGAGSGTPGNIDPTALSGFVEAGASSNISTSAMAGNYFLGSELSGDNFVGTGVAVASIAVSGAATGTQYDEGGINTGLETQSLGGAGSSPLAVTNADPVVPADTFPGIANVGPGTFGLTNGTRFIYFDTGASYGSNGTNGAQIIVVDHQ